MAAGGAEAVLIGVIPTPGAAYLCRTTDAAAAISISASHNPFEDNGVKIFGHDGMKLPDAIEEQIEDELRALRNEDWTVPGTPLTENEELIEAYEREHFPIPDPDPIDFLHHILEARQLSRKDLEPYIGSRARVAEVLNRVRPLTLEMIRKLADGLGLPADVLIRGYRVKRAA